MKIGIDLDNTIISYDKVFKIAAKSFDLISDDWSGNKEKLKSCIRQLPDGEKRWQKLQGYVYSEAIENADAFPGVIRFLWRAKNKGHHVFIISHKTEVAHHDSKINLRNPALRWLKEQQLLPESNLGLIKEILFLSTQKEKIKKINELNLDVMIDDLIEIVEHPLLDNNIDTIHFGESVYSTWPSIENYLLKNIDVEDCYALIRQSSLGNPVSCQTCNEGGNSSVWKIELENSSPVTVKYYINDLSHADRRVTEMHANQIMRKYGIENIPNVLHSNKYLEISVFEHINASTVQCMNESKVDFVSNFIEKLKDVGGEYEVDFPLASAACLCGDDIVKQINSRLSNLQQACENNAELSKFINNALLPTADKIIEWSKLNWPSKQHFNLPIEKTYQILTPSDIGAHNMMEDSDGSIFFIDFEYFGFDDPVKTASDFLLHPKNKIDTKLGKIWVGRMKDLFSDTDADFMQRLAVSWPLYGVCWCLIMLNEFRNTDWQRRKLSKELSEEEHSKVKSEQLNKSAVLLQFIECNYKQFPYL